MIKINKGIVALGICIMAISLIPLNISATVQISPSYIQDYRDTRGNLIAQVPHLAKFEAVYPYRWFGLVMILISLVTTIIGALTTKGAATIE